MNLLLISNSTNYGEKYLEWPKKHIKAFMQGFDGKEILFIPYAGVGMDPDNLNKSYDIYEKKVADVFSELGLIIHSIHHYDNPLEAVNQAKAIAVGGGNTFHLVAKLHEYMLMDAIAHKVRSGMPYMGWSAGSNVACPSLMTTNDMPIIQPQSFRCMNLIPFQINPHYIDAHIQGHAGESRKQRLDEFMIINKDMPVVGLREATLLEIHQEDIQLKGSRPLVYFRFGNEPVDYNPGDDISFLL